MKKRLFLGISKHNEVVFADVEVRMNRFSVSFDLSEPMLMTEEKFREGCEAHVEELPQETVLSLLENLDVKPSNLADKLFRLLTVEELYDTSLFPEVFSLGNKDVHFVSGSCGQVNIEDKMDLSLVPSLPVLELVLELWKEYHLETINTDSPRWREVFRSLDRYIEDMNYMDYIQHWIVQNRVELFGHKYQRVSEGVYRELSQKHMSDKAQILLDEYFIMVPLDTGEGFCPEEVMLFADELDSIGVDPLDNEDNLLDRFAIERHLELMLETTGWEVIKETMSKMDPDYSYHIIDDFGYLRPATREVVDTVCRTLILRAVRFLS